MVEVVFPSDLKDRNKISSKLAQPTKMVIYFTCYFQEAMRCIVANSLEFLGLIQMKISLSSML